jgi:predicted signal transduction protein with EAL and GGDEF domain
VAALFGQRVVGEGVETEAQMCFLQAHGCDEAQGYYLSMPLAAEHFARMLKPNMGSFIPTPCAKSGPATSPWLIPTKRLELH